ncbi:MAG: ABC transporter permease [Lachnospiraceae bacterium]|nr:ABC transporter permease [Lachnospiraceae bacterium]
MFLHNFKYGLLAALRDKMQLFWSFIFVALLGTLFFLTFGGAYEDMEVANNIPVAVYIDDPNTAAMFDSMIAEITIGKNNEKMFDITRTESLEEAKQLVMDKEVIGAYYSEDGELKLIVKEEGIRQSILSSVVKNYHQIQSIAFDVAAKDPSKINDAIAKFMTTENTNEEIVLTNNKMDMFTEYFYNLIAMGCLFACTAGITITVRNQANLSEIGARRSVAQTSTFAANVATLLANLILMFACEMLAIGYLMLIGVDFGTHIAQITLLVFVGTMTGISMGYFIGNIGKISANAKEGIGTAVILGLCFLSGLMFGDMKMIVIEHAPWFNKISPAALICDSFYALNVYDTNNQYWSNIVSLVIISVIFAVGGVLIGRRKKYASL